MYKALLPALFIATLSAQADTLFNRGHVGEPKSLDPQLAGNDGSGTTILFDLFEGLVTYAMNGDIVPGVAKSWDISEDGTTYTFHLRDNAQWSNGDPVTAQDFVYAWRRAVSPDIANEHASILYAVKNAEKIHKGEEKDPATLGITALDAHTVQVTLENPTPYFLELTAYYPAMPVPEKIIAAYGNDWTKPEHFVGNGPYRLAAQRPQVSINTEKSPTYWDVNNVHIDSITYHFSESTSSLLSRYRAGELDYIDVFPMDQIDWVRQNLPDELHTSPYLGIYYYGFNLDKEPFKSNRTLREALTLAVDRELLTEKIAKAGQQPAYAYVPPASKNHQPYRAPYADLSRDERIARAQALYAEAGYSRDKPLKTTLTYNTSESHKQIAVAVSAMWKQVLGVEIELENQEWKVLVGNLGNGNLPLFRYAATAVYNDPYYFLEAFISHAPQNVVRFANAEYDALLQQSNRTQDLAARAALLHQAETLLMDDYPLIPLYHYASAILLKPHIRGYQPNPIKITPSKYLSIAP